MATVNFAPESERPPLDRSLEENAQAAAALGKPVRIRLQPDLYDHAKASYQVWAGLTWSIEVGDVEEGRKLREGLTNFFRAFGAGLQEQTRVLEMLEGLRQGWIP